MGKAKVPKIEFVPSPHWSSQAIEMGLKSYTVLVNGKEIGKVRQEREHVYRKAGRLRYGDKYLIRWHYDAPGIKTYGLYYESRKRAVEELLRELERTPRKK